MILVGADDDKQMPGRLEREAARPLQAPGECHERMAVPPRAHDPFPGTVAVVVAPRILVITLPLLTPFASHERRAESVERHTDRILHVTPGQYLERS